MKTENMHVKMGQGVGFERIRRITDRKSVV